MIRFKPVVRRSHTNEDGLCNVKIRLTYNDKVRYLKTEYYVDPNFFNDREGRIEPHGLYTPEKADRANNRLIILIGAYASKLDNVLNMDGLSIQTVMKILREEKDQYDFFSVINEKIRELDYAGSTGYRDTFVNTQRLVQRFIQDVNLSFEQINEKWLKDFETFLLKEGKKRNTVGLHIRNIRKVYNDAIQKKLVDQNAYPFKRYRIPVQKKTAKRNLTVDELRLLRSYEGPNPYFLFARDMFMLSLYLIGINMKDLFYLSLADYDPANGRITYVRFKGKQVYDIKLYPEALEIIERYPGSAFLPDDATEQKPGERLLLDVMEGRYSTHKEAIRQVNIQLKRLATMVGIQKPLSTYYARHTFATLATRLGISRDTIRYGLGHGLNTMSDIYIEPEQEQVDKALRLLIDHINTPS